MYVLFARVPNAFVLAQNYLHGWVIIRMAQGFHYTLRMLMNASLHN